MHRTRARAYVLTVHSACICDVCVERYRDSRLLPNCRYGWWYTKRVRSFNGLPIPVNPLYQPDCNLPFFNIVFFFVDIQYWMRTWGISFVETFNMMCSQRLKRKCKATIISCGIWIMRNCWRDAESVSTYEYMNSLRDCRGNAESEEYELYEKFPKKCRINPKNTRTIITNENRDEKYEKCTKLKNMKSW